MSDDSLPDRQAGLGRMILVVEDEVLIALDLVGVLEESGYRVLGPSPSVEGPLNCWASTGPTPLSST